MRGAVLDDRMVVGAMAVFELEGGGAGGKAQQLVAQADAEDGLADGDGLADVGDGDAAHLRVARAVGEHQPVVVLLREVIVPGHHGHGGVAPEQAAQDVELGAGVDQDDALAAVAKRHLLFDADHVDQVVLVRVVEVDRRAALDLYLAKHGALFAQDLGQCAGVDVEDARHLVFLEPFAEAFLRVPVAVFERIVGNDEARNMYLVRFVEERDVIGVLFIDRHAIVADEREG